LFLLRDEKDTTLWFDDNNGWEQLQHEISSAIVPQIEDGSFGIEGNKAFDHSCKDSPQSLTASPEHASQAIRLCFKSVINSLGTALYSLLPQVGSPNLQPRPEANHSFSLSPCRQATV
jgi:hypothetical protein